MNDTGEEIAIRRILVALDTSSRGLVALETAADLATDMHAELQGLFVEDESLFRLAGLPFAQEILYSSAVARQMDLAAIERSWRVRAEELRRQFAELAERLRVKWSFDILRGRIVKQALAAAADADLLLIVRENRSPPAPAFTRRAAAPRPILVIYEGTPAGRRALITAARLVQDTGNRIGVLIAACDEGETEQLQEACAKFLHERNTPAVIEGSCITSGGQLVDTVRRRRAKLLLLSRDCSLLDEATIEQLVDDADCPVGLVR